MTDELITRTCAHCDGKFQITAWDAARRPAQFCSAECRNKARAKAPGEHYRTGGPTIQPRSEIQQIRKACDFCGAKFYRTESELKWTSGEFCSPKCRNTVVARRKVKHLIDCTCEMCGKAFKKRPDHVKKGWGRFCSNVCRIKFLTRPLAERFWDKVTKTDGCWLWKAGCDVGKWNYGNIKEGGKGTPTLSAHRVSWELHYGRIPDGLSVLHECDNPACVKPDHLFLGTHRDNTQDMMRKGRCGVAKLTAEKVLQMRAEWKTGNFKRLQLSELYDVSDTTVYYILSRRTWTHI